jgi:hypothetical protein
MSFQRKNCEHGVGREVEDSRRHPHWPELARRTFVLVRLCLQCEFTPVTSSLFDLFFLPEIRA